MSHGELFSKALHTTARQWRAALDRRLRDLGMSEAAWMTIAAAAKCTPAPSQSELAQTLAVEPATMVAMIDRLVKLGFVERVPSPLDRRVRHIAVTEAGQGVYERVKHEAALFRSETLSRIDPDKLAIASEVLEELQNIISES
ncbi:MAG: MarR family transcriptional regulator [Asticcacaulis sp.]